MDPMISSTPGPVAGPFGAAASEPRSRFRRALEGGAPVITAELAVPATVAHELIVERARELARPLVVAVNITDGLRGRPALSNVAAAAILTHADVGIEPILQLTARSRTRNALIADLLGASALGVRNLLCMTGDVPENSADIKDVDVFGLLTLARAFPAGLGHELLGPADPFCVGAAWSPFAPDPADEMDRLARKYASGAQFVQTQPVFDGPAFAEAMAGIPAELSALPIIMGLSAVRSAEHARRLATIPGIVIPPRLIQLLEGCADDAHASERYWEYLDAELDWLARNAPIRGCHLMPLGHSKRSMRQGSSFDHLYRSAARITGATAMLTPPA